MACDEVGHIITVAQRSCIAAAITAAWSSTLRQRCGISYLDATGQHCDAAEIAMRARTGDKAAAAAYSWQGLRLHRHWAHI